MRTTDAYGPGRLSLLDRVAERIYARSAKTLVTVAVGFAATNGILVTAAAVFTGIRYWTRYLDLAGAHATRIGIAAGVMTVVAVVTILPVAYLKAAPITIWLAERSEATAAAAWTGAAQVTPQVIRAGVVIFTVAYIPVIAVIAKEGRLPLSAIPFLFLYIEFAICFAAILDYFVIERMLLPMFRDLARFLPDGFVPEIKTPSLSLRIFPVFILVSIFTSITVSAFQPEGVTPATSFAYMLLVPIVVSLTLGLVPLLLLTGSVVSPVAQLRKTVERVETGDLSVRAPVLSADEVGHLTGSFNRMVTALQRLSVEVRESRSRIVAAADESRKRIERNIHDGAQQRLVALALDLRMLEEQVPDDLVPALHRVGDDLKAALGELRELARGLHPSILTTDGLGPAVEQLVSRSSIPVAVDVAEARFPEAVETACYFTVAEALANVAKYAEATEAAVRIGHQDGRVRLQVSDNGLGGADPKAGSGLTGLVDRIAALDGTLTVDSPRGVGTTVTIELPIPSTATQPSDGFRASPEPDATEQPYGGRPEDSGGDGKARRQWL